MTIARDSAARNSEPVTQIRSSGAVDLPRQLERLGRVGGDESGVSGQLEDRRGDVFRRDRAGVFDVARGDDHVEQREQRPELASRSLSRVVPKTSVRRARREAGQERIGQRGGRGGVVRTVDHEPGPFADHLDPRRPAQRGEPADDIVAAHGQAGFDLGQHIEARQRDRRIVRLVPAQKRQAQASPFGPPGPRLDKTRRRAEQGRLGRDRFVREIDPQLAQRAPALESDAADGVAWLAVAYAADRRPAALADPGLLGRDRRQRIAQLTRVVERDAGDDR